MMPKKKSPLPENVLTFIEKWGLKNCNTSEAAEKIVDDRIKRVCREIQETWTPKEEEQHKVTKSIEYLPPMYMQTWKSKRQEKKYEPDEQE